MSKNQDKVAPSRHKRKVEPFSLQPTASFSDGAPQREEYLSDKSYWAAVYRYCDEWQSEYFCPARSNHDPRCPQHGR